MGIIAFVAETFLIVHAVSSCLLNARVGFAHDGFDGGGSFRDCLFVERHARRIETKSDQPIRFYLREGVDLFDQQRVARRVGAEADIGRGPVD